MLVGVREGEVADGVAVVGEVLPHRRAHHQVEFLTREESIGHGGHDAGPAPVGPRRLTRILREQIERDTKSGASGRRGRRHGARERGAGGPGVDGHYNASCVGTFMGAGLPAGLIPELQHRRQRVHAGPAADPLARRASTSAVSPRSAGSTTREEDRRRHASMSRRGRRREATAWRTSRIAFVPGERRPHVLPSGHRRRGRGGRRGGTDVLPSSRGRRRSPDGGARRTSRTERRCRSGGVSAR